MRRALPGLCLLLAVQAAPAQDEDALRSDPCRGALAALQAQEAAAAATTPAREPEADEAAHHAALARLNAARDRAARACLQGRADQPARPGRLATPPLSVPPLAVTPQTAPLPLPPAGIPVPLPRAAPPVSITTCDALGCWASDGTRLPRAGPNLIGPRGFCTAPGGVLHCPP